MTQGEDCPLDAICRPDYPEVMPMAVSVNAEVKTIRCEKKNSNVYFTFCFLLFFSPLAITATCLVGISQDVEHTDM